MKIAIHTLIGHYNYGCLLQAFALQSTLERLGHNVKIINRREDKPNNKVLCRRFLSVLKNAIKRYFFNDRKAVVGNPYDYFYFLKDIDFSFLKEFAQKNLKYTKLFRSTYSLSKYVKKNKFDAYVVGSDQVWREEYAPDILDSFLRYLPKNDESIRISYAASFGTTELPISKDKLPECVGLAKKFKAISVREKSAIGLVNEHFGLDAVHVLDPTLLLDANDYHSIVKDNMFGRKQVVSYILDKSEEKTKIVQTLSTMLDAGLLNLTDYPLNEEGRKQPYSVENWLAAISNAEFIVTDSFHGCVFSIIFNKPFIVIANRGRGIERFLSILELLGLEERLVFSYSDAQEKIQKCLCAPVDDKVLAKLVQAKDKSIKFLSEHLS